MNSLKCAIYIMFIGIYHIHLIHLTTTVVMTYIAIYKMFTMGTQSQYSYHTNVQNCNLKYSYSFSIVGISAMRRLVAPNGSNLMLT